MRRPASARSQPSAEGDDKIAPPFERCQRHRSHPPVAVGTVSTTGHLGDMTRFPFHAADGSQSGTKKRRNSLGWNEAKSVALDILTELLPGKAEEFWS